MKSHASVNKEGETFIILLAVSSHDGSYSVTCVAYKRGCRQFRHQLTRYL